MSIVGEWVAPAGGDAARHRPRHRPAFDQIARAFNAVDGPAAVKAARAAMEGASGPPAPSAAASLMKMSALILEDQ